MESRDIAVTREDGLTVPADHKGVQTTPSIDPEVQESRSSASGYPGYFKGGLTAQDDDLSEGAVVSLSLR